MSIRNQEASLASLFQRRTEILTQLSSSDRRRPSESFNYGDHNPFLVALANCDRCGHTPESPHVSARVRNRTWWVVSCKCGHLSGEGQREPWMASLMWNANNLRSQRYQDLPLFDLSCLDQEAAKARVRGIRESLTLRLDLCSLDCSIAAVDRTHPRPGQQYRLRLDAYLKWAMLASRLIKLATAKGQPRKQELPRLTGISQEAERS